MTGYDLIPAATIALSVIAILGGAELLPVGKDMLLVRVSDRTPVAGLIAAASADAAYISSPAPGFAVLYGQSAQIRAAYGFAVRWRGFGLCGRRA